MSKYRIKEIHEVKINGEKVCDKLTPLKFSQECSKCGALGNGTNWDEAEQYAYCDDCIEGYIKFLETGEE